MYFFSSLFYQISMNEYLGFQGCEVSLLLKPLFELGFTFGPSHLYWVLSWTMRISPDTQPKIIDFVE